MNLPDYKQSLENARAYCKKYIDRLNELLPGLDEGNFTMDEFQEAHDTMEKEGFILSFKKNPRNPHCWNCWTINLKEVNVGKCSKCGGYICPKCGSCHQDCDGPHK